MQIILSVLVVFLVQILQNLNRELNNHSINSDISQFKTSYNLDNFTDLRGCLLLVNSRRTACVLLCVKDESYG